MKPTVYLLTHLKVTITMVCILQLPRATHRQIICMEPIPQLAPQETLHIPAIMAPSPTVRQPPPPPITSTQFMPQPHHPELSPQAPNKTTAFTAFPPQPIPMAVVPIYMAESSTQSAKMPALELEPPMVFT